SRSCAIASTSPDCWVAHAASAYRIDGGAGVPAVANADAVHAESASDTVRTHRRREGRISQRDSVTVVARCDAEALVRQLGGITVSTSPTPATACPDTASSQLSRP